MATKNPEINILKPISKKQIEYIFNDFVDKLIKQEEASLSKKSETKFVVKIIDIPNVNISIILMEIILSFNMYFIDLKYFLP